MGKEELEKEKIKVEILEKETNLIFKQIVVYLTILGSIIAFLIKNISFQINIEELLKWLLPFSSLLGIVLGNFMYWLFTSIKRLKNIKLEIERINKRIKDAKYVTG